MKSSAFLSRVRREARSLVYITNPIDYQSVFDAISRFGLLLSVIPAPGAPGEQSHG